MNPLRVKRRDFLSLASLATVYSLSGCVNYIERPILRASRKTLPKDWLDSLPSPWIYKDFSIVEGETLPLGDQGNRTDLFAIGDGWLKNINSKELNAINSDLLFSKLDANSRSFLKSLGMNFAGKLLPVGRSPWVIIFKDAKDSWVKEGNQTWDILLEEDLKGKVVFPESSRLLISLSQRIASDDALRKLVNQALTFNDRNTFNWLLSNDARAAVMPLDRCFGSVLKDPRLSIALPVAGAPLHWTLLARTLNTKEPVPVSWVMDSWKPRLLSKLLIDGWTPPILNAELEKSLDLIPIKYHTLLIRSEQFYQNSWSMPPLNKSEEIELQEIWRQSFK